MQTSTEKVGNLANSDVKLDTLNCDDFSLEGLHLLSRREDLFQTLGNPDSVVISIDSVDEPPIELEKIYIKKSWFEFEDQTLGRFKIVDEQFALDKDQIRVGDTVEKVLQSKEWQFANEHNEKNKSLTFPIVNCETAVEVEFWVSFNYDSNGIIRLIQVGYKE